MPYFAAAGLAISAYGAYSSAKGTKKQAKAQKKAAKTQATWNRGALIAKVDSLYAAKNEGHDKHVEAMGDVARASAIMRGRMAVGASESGAAGNSVSAGVAVAYAEQARTQGREIKNYDSFQKQINRDIRGTQTGLNVQTEKYSSKGATAQAALGFASDALGIAQNAGWFKSTPTTPTPVSQQSTTPTK